MKGILQRLSSIYFSWPHFFKFLFFFFIVNCLIDVIIARFVDNFTVYVVLGKLLKDFGVIFSATILLAFLSNLWFSMNIMAVLEKFSFIFIKFCNDLVDGKYDFCPDKNLLKFLLVREAFKAVSLRSDVYKKTLSGEIDKFEDDLKEGRIAFEKHVEEISIMAHKLRTPVSAVKWNLEMMKNGEFGPVAEEQQSALDDALSANQRIISFIEELLKSSRLDKTKKELELTEIDLVSLVDSVIKSFNFKIKARNAVIAKKFPEKRVAIKSDLKSLEDIIANLLDNSLKYSLQNTKIEIGFYEKDGKNVIYVKDNGIGIPEKDQSQIFTKFFRASNGTSVNAEGTGLGLFICKRLALFLGGRIWFESIESKGSTFYVELP